MVDFLAGWLWGVVSVWLVASLVPPRRRGSNPPPPGRKPAPPAGPRYGWGPRQLNPPTPAPGMRRVYLDQPAQMAECGGSCWEAQDPRCCDCGALWRDVPIRMDEGRVQRGGSRIGRSPTAWRLARRNGELVLQAGSFWTQDREYGIEWNDVPTVNLDELEAPNA